jgi:hypothetical protein
MRNLFQFGRCGGTGEGLSRLSAEGRGGAVTAIAGLTAAPVVPTPGEETNGVTLSAHLQPAGDGRRENYRACSSR